MEGLEENLTQEESQEEFDQYMRDFWGDDYQIEEPEDEGADPANGGGDPASAAEEDTPETKEEQQKPERAKLEQDMMAQRIQRERQMAVDDFVRRQFAGQVDPYTGKPITTAAELEAYQGRYAEEQLKSQLEGAGLDRNVLNQLIAEHPAVREAQRATAQAKTYMQKQEAMETENFTREELRRLQADHPDCGLKSLAELGATAEGRQALEYWRIGVPLSQAYSAAFSKQITEKRVSAAKQQARNDAMNKSHIQQAKGGESREKTMDAEELSAYRAFFPKMTDAQLQEMWRKNQ